MNLSSNTKPVPILGEIPPGYDGPILYRTVTSQAFGFSDKLRCDETDPREQELLAGRPFTGERRPAELVDQEGRLLPKWQRPLKGYIRQKVQLSFDWLPAGWTRAYVRDIIEELDPGKHIFLPHDMQWDDGRVERFYSIEWTRIDCFQRLDERPFLDVEKNGLSFRDFPNGRRAYTCPDWTGICLARKASEVDATSVTSIWTSSVICISLRSSCCRTRPSSPTRCFSAFCSTAIPSTEAFSSSAWAWRKCRRPSRVAVAVKAVRRMADCA